MFIVQLKNAIEIFDGCAYGCIDQGSIDSNVHAMSLKKVFGSTRQGLNSYTGVSLFRLANFQIQAHK